MKLQKPLNRKIMQIRKNTRLSLSDIYGFVDPFIKEQMIFFV